MNKTSFDLAAYIRDGYEAKVVGDEPLLGVSLSMLWLDGVLVESRPRRTSQPGIWLTGPEGDTILYATATRERAEELLRAAAAELTSRR